MARSSYSKTTWVDRNATDPLNVIAGTKLNAANLNKLEQGLADSDAASVALEARVLTIESSGPVGEQTAEITQLISDLNASELAVTALTNVVAQLRADFDKHTHENVVGDVTGPVVLA